MCFALGAGAGMPGMQMRIVPHLDLMNVKRGLNHRPYPFRTIHLFLQLARHIIFSRLLLLRAGPPDIFRT